MSGLREALAAELSSEDAHAVLYGVTGTHPESYGGVTKDEALECAGELLTRLRALLAEHPATPAEEVAEVAVEEREAFIDLLVQHPMWIDNDGNDLDYTMEREARIADFVDAAWSQVAALTAKAKAEAWDEGYEAGGDDQINAYWADYSMQANPYREPR